MEQLPRIGIVGGNGIIGGALARALVAGGLVKESALTLSCRSAPPGWLPQARWTDDNAALVAASDVVIVSVRPQQWEQMTLRAEGRLVVSVMAGVSMAALQAGTGSARIIRALPNAAADVGASYTPWTAAPDVTAADRATMRAIFSACGTEDEVADEAAIDYLGCTSGTGPAYPALLAAAMVDDAIAHGLSPKVAQRAAVALLVGTGRMFEKSDDSPATVVQGFVDYAGITATAIKVMRSEGFEPAVKTGIAAALAQTRGDADARQ